MKRERSRGKVLNGGRGNSRRRASNVHSAVKIMAGVGVPLHCSLAGFGNHPGGIPLGITVKSSSERMN